MAHVDIRARLSHATGRTAAKARDTEASLEVDVMCFSGESMSEAKSLAVRVKASVMLDLPRSGLGRRSGSISWCDWRMLTEQSERAGQLSYGT